MQDHVRAKALLQTVHIDDELGLCLAPAWIGRTSIGCPGLKRAAFVVASPTQSAGPRAGQTARAVFTFVAAETPSNLVAVMAISAAVFLRDTRRNSEWSPRMPCSGPVRRRKPEPTTCHLRYRRRGALAPTVTGFIVQATGTFVPALLVGAVIALASALAYLVVIPNRPIRPAELGVAAPSARPSGASM
jgi:hypothetical protein